MCKKYAWFSAVACALVLLLCTFIFWPLLGHDYSLIVPSLIDLKVAFSQHGVLNPHFSPMKCLGTPLWANPVSFNLSLLHILTLISSDLIGIGLFIIIVALSSFYGAYKLARYFEVSESWALYLAAGWTLQGWMVMRSIVGHTTYITLGWFPLLVYLLLKKRTPYRDMAASLLVAVLISQYVFLAAPYTPFFLLGSFLCLLPLIYFWKQKQLLDWKSLFWKSAFSGVIAFNIIYPKLSAVRDLMSSYPRHESLVKVGLRALPYSVMNLFSFYPHDYKFLVEWWYGNWESIQYLNPLFLLTGLVILLRRKNEKEVARLLGSVLYLATVSLVFCSGNLSDFFQKIPVLSSMHVNPRWNIMTALPVFFLSATLAKTEGLFSRKWFYGLTALVYLVPFIHLRPNDLNISYSYRRGYVPELNRLAYCYEPFLGYKLENFPYIPPTGSINFVNDPSLDPRCYLPSQQCSPGTLLDPNEQASLDSYKLR